MPEFPSPVYCLLSTPGWLNQNDASNAARLQGLMDWDFDVNETFQGTSLLGVMLQRTHLLHTKECDLIRAVEILLGRGADPQGAFQVQGAAIQWERMPGVKRLVSRRLLPEAIESPRDPRADALFSALREQGSPDMILSRVLMKLGNNMMQEQVEGLNAGAWIALHATRAGDSLPGWCNAQKSYGGEEARLARVARKIVVEAKLFQSGTPLERVIAACGLASAVASFGNSQQDDIARAAAINTSNKLLQGLDCGMILAQAAASSELTREQKSRLGMAMLRSFTVLEDPSNDWKKIVGAWGLLEDPRLDLSVHSIRTRSGLRYLPGKEIEGIPRTACNQQILVDFLLAQLEVSMNPPSQERLIAFVEALGRWRAGYDLPDFNRRALEKLASSPDARKIGLIESMNAMMLDSATSKQSQPNRRGNRL